MAMTGSIASPALLSSIRSTPNLPCNVYSFLACSTLSTLNIPQEIPHVLRYALAKGGGPKDSKPEHAEQLRIVRQIRESIIKLVAIAGLPKSINAMNALKSATPPDLLDEPLGFSPTGRASEMYNLRPAAIFHRGQRFFDGIYGKIAGRVMRSMDRSGTEDLGLMARLMYGYALSNTSILSARDSSYVLLAGLIPQDVNPQLKGHLRGAVNHGRSTAEEVKAVREVVLRICEASGMRKIEENVLGGWGWRETVADI